MIRTSNVSNVIDPSTNSVVAATHLLDENDQKLSLLNEGLVYSKVDISKVLQNLLDWLSNNRMELASVCAQETGSPISYHLEDLDAISSFIKGYPAHLNDYRDYMMSPKGKVFMVLSANEPVILSTLPLLVALILGNSVTIKPSSKTPSYSNMLVQALFECGLPKSQLSLIYSTSKLTQKLLTGGIFDLVISFAHSSTNKTFSQYIDRSKTEFIDENEGNDWMYIDKTFSISEAELSSLLIKSFIKHNGQMCDAIRGLLIHQDQFENVKDSLIRKLDTIKVGDPQNPKTDYGYLLPKTDQHLNSVVEAIEDEVIYQKSDGETNFHPTLLINPSDDIMAYSQPPFGPIMWLKSVSSPKEVVEFYHQHNKHGLSFSVVSSEKHVIQFFLKSLPVARFNINTNPVDVDIFSPWGGYGLSGHTGATGWFDKFSNKRLLNYGQF
jgi:acyl-CoA reductase-like NAD-dependent aldehyde dehydrogenase